MAELKRGFGFFAVLALAIGSISGTGLFFGASLGAKYSGNSSIFAWLLIFALALYIAACFGELAAMYPSAGGMYEFNKQAYGRFTSFFVGWTSWIMACIGTALLVVAALDYLTPAAFPGAYKISLAILFLLILNIVAYVGLEASSMMLLTFAGIIVGVCLLIIIPGLFHVHLNNFNPIMTHSWPFVLLTIFFIFETFMGWESVTNLAEETKDPEKNIPKALMWGTLIVGILTLLMVFVSLGIVPWIALAGSSAPLNTIAQIIFGDFGKYISGIGVYLVMLASAAGGIIALPRLLLALARDKLFLVQFTEIHHKYKTPYKAVILQFFVMVGIVLLAYGRYETLLSILIPIALIVYALTLIGVTVLRYKHPKLHRPFRVWFGKTIPLAVAGILLAVLITWIVLESRLSLFLLGMSILAVGIPLYFLIEMYYDKRMIIKVNDFFARLTLFTEEISLPRRIKKDIMQRLGDIKKKTVLEFGCRVGTFTLMLAEAVGKEGKVYATNISKKEGDITRERMVRYGHSHVEVIHEQDFDNVHISVKKADLAVSAGGLSTVVDIKTALIAINRKLPVNGKILFLDYDKFFWIIPNVDWLGNDIKLLAIFKECGFKVTIERRQGMFWQYVYVEGKKVKNV